MKGTDLQMSCSVKNKRWEEFKNAKQCVKENRDIIGEKNIWSDESIVAINMEDKKVAWKYYYKRLPKEENTWNEKEKHGIKKRNQ